MGNALRGCPGSNEMRPFGPDYERIGDSMTIGGATLEHILYEFHNGGFSEAFMVATKGISNAAAMIAARHKIESIPR
jgi:hypothetical protein